jgi:hypothetical protein
METDSQSYPYKDHICLILSLHINNLEYHLTLVNECNDILLVTVKDVLRLVQNKVFSNYRDYLFSKPNPFFDKDLLRRVHQISPVNGFLFLCNEFHAIGKLLNNSLNSYRLNDSVYPFIKKLVGKLAHKLYQLKSVYIAISNITPLLYSIERKYGWSSQRDDPTAPQCVDFRCFWSVFKQSTINSINVAIQALTTSVYIPFVDGNPDTLMSCFPNTMDSTEFLDGDLVLELILKTGFSLYMSRPEVYVTGEADPDFFG